MASHSDSFCIKSVRPQKLDINIDPTEDFDFGEALGQVYPLLDLIFQYLPINDLKSCLKVSPLWGDKANEAVSRRRAPSWCTCYKTGSKSQKSNIISHSSNLNFNNVELGIFIYDSCRFKMNKCICVHSNIAELSRKSVPEYLEEELVPKGVDYCLLSVHRSVSYFAGVRAAKELQDHGSIFDGIFIPKIPYIRTALFHCNPSKKKELKETVNLHIKEDEELKCLLVICKTQLQESLYKLLDLVVPKEQPSAMALGGGIVRGTKTFQRIGSGKKYYPAMDTVCIAFLRDSKADIDNFRAYSMVINADCYGDYLTKEEFVEKLKNFRKNIEVKRHSVGFRFCCSAKFQESEVESFESVFPELPLLGFHVYGEIGWNSYPNAPENEPAKANKRLKTARDYPKAENFFSTLFVLVTWD